MDDENDDFFLAAPSGVISLEEDGDPDVIVMMGPVRPIPLFREDPLDFRKQRKEEMIYLWA